MNEQDTEINLLRSEVKQLRLIIMRAIALLHQTNVSPAKCIRDAAEILGKVSAGSESEK